MEQNLKRLLILLGLLIFSPLVLNIAFKALRIFKDYPKVFLAYILLIAGILLTLYSVYYGFRTFKGIVDTLFKE
ncbi:conserved hypothetical protein [Tenacibaculum litopenaei]|jgi:phosphoglycerol transferase MdoB-like AlkP superfamily enzyme|uniref:DUF6095 family protein n=1 Tax=Tenacibaculum litopenaei TaxID=396016 RepID=UPI00389350F2